MEMIKHHLPNTLFLCAFLAFSGGLAFRHGERSASNEGLSVHHQMSRRELENYFGVSSHSDVPEYHITEPLQADENGRFASYKLHQHARAKRSAEKAPNFWYYNVNAFGISLHLNLSQNTGFLAPNLLVESHGDNGTISYGELPKHTYYHGHVTQDPDSFVAVSNRDGLTGVLQYLDESLFMQPLPSHLAKRYGTGSGAQPHIIYRRSAKGSQGAKRRKKRSSEKLLKRSTAGYKYLEIALVADPYAIAVHLDGMANHMLLIAHIMNSLFHDASVGQIKIAVVVVKVVLKTAGFGYSASASSGVRLKALQTWALSSLERENGKPQHPDSVSLFTRGMGGGLAVVNTICDDNREFFPFGVNVNDDLGLNAALIVAHETAHVFGLDHDEAYKRADCPKHTNIMASSTVGGPGAFRWSPCSREKIQELLSSKKSWCLDNVPTGNILGPREFYTKLPGQVVNADQQCKITEGAAFQHCSRRKSDCHHLFCTNNNQKTCVSAVVPAADGTRCGVKHWCIKGKCVDDGSSMIDGGWGSWGSTYSVCSQTCGRGVQYRSRQCNNPSPQNGGKACEGSSKGLWKICNPTECPTSSPQNSFRDIQCKAFSADLSAYFTSQDPCGLYCRKGSYGYNKGIARDGTPCHKTDEVKKKVCVEGQCKFVGCDNVLESGLWKDRCGRCGGDGSSCKVINGEYNKDYRNGWGMDNADTIVTFPPGTTSIWVKENAEDKNMLGIKGEEGIYLNKLWYASHYVNVAGTKLLWTREKKEYAESVTSLGPTTEAVTISFLYFGPKNQGVKYRYCTPGHTTLSQSDVMWQVADWGSCSQKCGGGVQSRKVGCVIKEDKTYVKENVCTSTKPADQQSCNTNQCTPKWFISGWRPCSRTCGKGYQLRTVVCRRMIQLGKYETVADHFCSGAKPSDTLTQECNKRACPAEYRQTSWSACSKTCGGGVETTTLVCQHRNELGNFVDLPEVLCKHINVKPPTSAACNTDVVCSPVVLPTFPSHGYLPPNVYRHLGCFKDSFNRSLPINLGGVLSIRQCFEKATTNGFEVFGIQNKAECWSGPTAYKSYNRYGASSNCDPDTNMGGPWSNDVYALDYSLSHLGCYRDSSDRAVGSHIGSVKNIRECYQKIVTSGFKVFGIQNGGECWSGPIADKTYAKHGKLSDAENKCKDGLGGPWLNDVYRLRPPFTHIGCFRDKHERALPTYLGVVSSVSQCSEKAKEKHYKVFGLQNQSECWSGQDAQKTYNKYGSSLACKNGLGDGWANDVYFI